MPLIVGVTLFLFAPLWPDFLILGSKIPPWFMSEAPQSFLQFQKMLEGVSDLVFFKDRDLRYTGASKAFLEFSGVNLEDILGKSLVDILDPELAEPHQAMDRSVVEEGKSYRFEQLVTSLSGKTRLMDIMVSPMTDGEGKITGLMGLGRDITHIREAEEELKHKNRALEKSNYELDALIYRAAHEMRAPVLNLKGFNDLLKDEQEVSAIRKLLQYQQLQIDKLDAVIREIMELSQSSRLANNVRQLNLMTVISESLRELEDFPGREDVNIVLNMDRNLQITTDPSRLGLIFFHLVQNALQYRNQDREDPEIEIVAERNDDEIKVSIKDNGIGMNESVREKAFEMFFRGTARSTGAGLGLYLVFDAIERLKGRISVDSTEGVGTEFVFYIPDLAPKEPD